MGEWQDIARTILGWIGLWCAASFLFVGACAVIGYRLKSAREPEVDMSWPGHSFRIVDHDPSETVEQRYRSAAQ